MDPSLLRSGVTKAQLQQFRVVDLKRFLSQHSLETRGLKSVLIDRVYQHLEDQMEQIEQDVDLDADESASSVRRRSSQVGKRSRK